MQIAGGITYDPIGTASTFDGKKPTPHHGLKLVGPDHFLAVGKRLKFASVEPGRQVTVNFLWLKARAKPRQP